MQSFFYVTLWDCVFVFLFFFIFRSSNSIYFYRSCFLVLNLKNPRLIFSTFSHVVTGLPNRASLQGRINNTERHLCHIVGAAICRFITGLPGNNCTERITCLRHIQYPHDFFYTHTLSASLKSKQTWNIQRYLYYNIKSKQNNSFLSLENCYTGSNFVGNL